MSRTPTTTNGGFADRIFPKFVEALRLQGEGEPKLDPEAVSAAAREVANAIAALGKAAGEQCRLVMHHLTDPLNTGLRARIRDGALDGDAVARMVEKDLTNPQVLEKQAKEKEARLAARNTKLLKEAQACPTALYKCPKCGARRCNMQQKQTRSGDEPMTVYLTCLECDLRFRRW